MNKKIQDIIELLDVKVFELRMGLQSLQSELGDSQTVSLNEHGTLTPKTALFDSPKSKTEPNVIVGNDPGDENDSVEPDGFHGKSYADFEKDISAAKKEYYCQCEEVKTYGMVCVTCNKPYQMKTTFTTNGSAGVSGSE